MTGERLYFPAAEITNLAGWLLSATTERGPLEGDSGIAGNSIVALYCIDYQSGAHSLSLHFILNQSLSWGPWPARGPKQLLGLLAF